MARIGVVQRRQREAGSWVIDEEPLDEGEGWQDWPAFHRVATTDRARIRFYVSRPGATSTERAKLRRVAGHEYRIMSRLANDRLLCPRDMVDNDLGVGLVYPLEERFQRLDLWLAPLTGLSSSGVTDLPGDSGGGSPVPGQSGTAVRLGAVDVDRRLAGAFEAPEGVWNRDADRIRLDVFALGALAYFVLTGHPPASDRAALRERLHRENGLELSADLPQVPSAVRAMVLDATRPAVSERLADVRTFRERLDDAQRALDGPADDVADPLDAAPGAVIAGRFRLQRRERRPPTRTARPCSRAPTNCWN